MSFQRRPLTDPEVTAVFRSHGITPTAQRLRIARTLLASRLHMAAEDVFRTVNEGAGKRISKATVYNTLALLVEKGVIRAVVADPARVMYDPNVSPHYHFYDEANGELTDIDAADVQLTQLPRLPEGTELRGIDVIIRLRRSSK